MRYYLFLTLVLLSSTVKAESNLPIISVPYDVYYIEAEPESELDQITNEIESASPEKDSADSREKKESKLKTLPAYVHEEYNKDHPPLPEDSALMSFSKDHELWSLPKKQHERKSERQAVPSGYVDRRISVYKRIIPIEEQSSGASVDNEHLFRWRDQNYLYNSNFSNDPTKIPNANLFLRK